MTFVPGWMWHDDALAASGSRGVKLDARSDGRARPSESSDRGSNDRAAIAELGVGAGVDRRAIVGVDDVARGAAAGAIVAGVIVGAEEVERRVEQARALQADEDGIGAVLGAEAADR